MEEMTLGQAVAKGTINSQTLAYFLGRTWLFLLTIGVRRDRLRFRQHQKDEMAHYASDCWDAEIHTSYGWIEVAGHADRSAYDLEKHSQVSGVDLSARQTLSPPREVEVANIKYNFAKLKDFGKNTEEVKEHIKTLATSKVAILDFKSKLQQGPQEVKTCKGNSFTITNEMFEVILKKEKQHVRSFIPNVIEPSFGLGRIFYCLLEHVFDDTMYPNDEDRQVLKLPPVVAPYKVAIIPQSANDAFTPFCLQLRKKFVELAVSTQLDDSSVAIGRKYARADSLGIPFAVTVDFDTVKQHDAGRTPTVTIRDRDSKGSQIRVSIEEGPLIVQRLATGAMLWADAQAKYPKFDRPEKDS